jgi:hypothetical protein
MASKPHGCSPGGASPGVAAQEEDLRGLADLVGVLPCPCAFGVGGAESVLHDLPQGRRGEPAAGGEGGQDRLGAAEEAGWPCRGRGGERPLR